VTEVQSSEYGQATLDPAGKVTAGTYNTWDITYTVDDLGMDDGSTLKIAGNMTSDWGTPQFNDSSGDNYATVKTSGDATLEASYNPKGHVRPWKHTITIDVFDGSLDKGDTIHLTLGDRSGGGLGHRAQSFPEEDFRIAVLVDPFGTGEFVQLPEELTFDVVPGTANSISAVVPSTTQPNEPVNISVRVEDYWGNTVTDYEGLFTVTTDNAGVETSVEVQSGTGTATVSLSEPGTHRLNVTADNSQLEATTNPVLIGETDEDIFWGDIHGQSGETVGTGTIWEYLTYARDDAFLDFTSHAANDFQITDEFWEEIQNAIQEYHNPGDFVTFLAYEWSANTSRGGDHNVYFKNSEADIHRSSSWQIEDGREKHKGLHPVSALYDHYEGRDDVLIIPHQGGRPATLDVLDPELSPFVEIVSVWGVFEWLGQDALEEGYHVGFVGGSDDHTNRVGVSHPTNQTDFNIKGGLMAVKADELSRDSLWETFKQRRCYATTGAHIILETTIGDTGMGGTVTVDDAPEIDVAVEGTAPLSRVELYRGSKKVAERAFDDGTRAVELRWSGARSRTRHKVQDWSGGLSVDCGQIADVEEFGFDHPEQGVTHQTDTSIRWDGSTSGNYQGIRVQFDAPDDTTASFSSTPVSTEFTLGELDSGREIDAGHLDQQLEIRQVGTSTQKHSDLTFTDEEVDSGTHPYFVRVSQIDGEMAWSSPIMVDVE
jgi:hypothetical protein